MKIDNLEALAAILPNGVRVMDQVILNGKLGDPRALSFDLRPGACWAIKLANMTQLEDGGEPHLTTINLRSGNLTHSKVEALLEWVTSGTLDLDTLGL